MNKQGNTSSAVMQQRNKPRNDGLDDFPTPPWATRALLHHVVAPRMGFQGQSLSDLTVWEPACNRGYMARPLAESFARVHATDIKDYGWSGQKYTHDFLFGHDGWTPDWIITNPPFRLAEQFADRCLRLAPREGFALLVRSAFLEGNARYEKLFSKDPPTFVAQFVERVDIVEGRVDQKANSATSYCWLVWERGAKGAPEFIWIPPCRRALERPSDYTWENDNG